MIKGSVGRGGLNKKLDVIQVQKLLNNFIRYQPALKLKMLAEDSVCGGKTIAAIDAFQMHVVGTFAPDGRVDVAGKTIKELQLFGKFGSAAAISSAAFAAPKVVTNSKPKTVTPAPALTTPVATFNTDPRKLTTRAQVAAVYGAISSDKKWAKQSQFLGAYTVPSAIANDKSYAWVNAYDTKKREVTKIWCHKAMHSFLDKALNNLKSRNLLGDLKEYGGCHAIRATRGTNNWSAHSWALAIDINMTGNGLGETPKMSAEFAKCFTDAGFGWGGNYTRKDGMHFTLAGFDMPRK